MNVWCYVMHVVQNMSKFVMLVPIGFLPEQVEQEN